MQFGFMPGCGTTDAMFIVRQIQVAYIRKKSESVLCFCSLRKSLWQSTKESLMVGPTESWCTWMGCASDTGNYQNAGSQVKGK